MTEMVRLVHISNQKAKNLTRLLVMDLPCDERNVCNASFMLQLAPLPMRLLLNWLHQEASALLSSSLSFHRSNVAIVGLCK